MDRIRLTADEATELLKSIERSQPVGFTAITDPRMTVTDNPFRDRVDKVTIGSGWINFRYSRTVNRQRIREGRPADFVADRRKWGRKLPHCPVIEHTVDDDDEFYLEIKRERWTSHHFERRTAKRIPRHELRRWLPAEPLNKRQRLSKPVALRDYTIRNLAELRIDQSAFTITPTCDTLYRYIPARNLP